MRIVSLLSSATEMLFALGLGEEVVAISHECDFPPEAASRPRSTRSLVDSSRPSQEIDEQVQGLLASGAALYEIDRALIRRLAPDLIVTQAQCDVCAVRYQDVIDFVRSEPALRQTRVLSLAPQSLDDVLADMDRIGEAASARRQAHDFIERLSARIRRVAERTQSSVPIKGRPRVVCIEWVEPLMTAGNWTPQLIELAGGESCLAVAGRPSEYVAWEAIRAAACDVLLIAPCGFDLARSQHEAQRLVGLPGFDELPAVRSQRAFVLDGNAYLNRSGPRLVDSLEILAHLIEQDAPAPLAADQAEGCAWTRI